MAQQDRDIRKYRRASGQRLESAEILLRTGRYHDSMYLAGYVVECALKAVILARTPVSQRKVTLIKIGLGQKAHDFEYLKEILRNAGCTLPRAENAMLRRVATWSTAWRYEVGRGDADTARYFLDNARGIHDWMEKNL